MKFSYVLSFLTLSASVPGGLYAQKCGSNPHDDAIKYIIKGMTLEQKITQKLMPDMRTWNYGGCSAKASNVEVMNDELAASISKYSFGGMLLFAENVVNTERATRLTEAMQKANAVNNKIPLFIGIDQEGGIVTRLGNGTMLPGNMAAAATRNPNNAFNSGWVTGSEVKSVGVNVNFAPDSDVNVNPENPVIGVRSFGSNPNLVAEYAVQYLNGMKQARAIGSAKHFPGHGDTATDSHFGLPLVNKTLEQIERVEIVPFKAMIDNGIDMMMTAHIQYPALDSTTIPNIFDTDPLIRPATLSRKIMTDYLRGKLGFKGVSITDAMNMAALLKYVGSIESVSQTIRAGVDIALMPVIVRCVADFKLYDDVINRIKDDISQGLYSVTELDESVHRILSLKAKYNLLSLDPAPIEARVSNALATVGNAENKAIEKKMAQDAITLVKNDATYGIPFNFNDTSKVLVFMPDATQVLSVSTTITGLGIKASVSSYTFTNRLFTAADATAIDNADYIIIGSLVTTNTPAIDGGDIFIDPGKVGAWAYSFPAAVTQRAAEKKKPIAVISLRNPYDTANFEKTQGAVLCAYGMKGLVNGVFGQPNLPAAISTILGFSKPKGKLPVDIPSVFDETAVLYPYGHGLTL